MTFDDYLVTGGCTVADALKKLEQNEYKALVLERDGRLSGIVTDGDIRRYLLKGGGLENAVEKAATGHPVFVGGYHELPARKKLEQRLTCVPMVDEGGKIHALVFQDVTLHRESDEIGSPVIIMAGGLGTRLRPYTEILPKPLIPVGRSTITELIIGRFRKFGCREVTLVVNHKKNLIKSYFSEVDTGCRLHFADEDIPLGTGGGLAFFKGRFREPVFVTYCDNVIEADYRDILKRHVLEGNDLTMVVARRSSVIPYGVIETDETGAVAAIREKPEQQYLINAGMYVLSPSFIESVEDGVFQHITDLAMRCKERGGRIGSYEIDGACFIDIGQLEDLKELGDKLR